MLRRTLFLVLLAASVVLAARVSEQYAWRLDVTAQQLNSLSASARRALDALPGDLEMTAFIPDFPVQRAQLEKMLAPYIDYSDKVSLTIVDPVRDPGRARELGAARHGELQLRLGAKREVIASPTPLRIDRALNRLALQGERWIVTFKGHGESPIDDTPVGIARFVAHAEGLGYRFVSVDPRHIDGLPENTRILLIAGPQRAYGAHTVSLMRRFLADGGALLWLSERPLPDFLATMAGVELLPGTVVDAAAALHGLETPDNAIIDDYPPVLIAHKPEKHSVIKQAAAMNHRDNDDWQLKARLHSSPRSWNETGELRGSLSRDPELGEQAGPLTIAVALERNATGPAQRMVILASSQFIGNDQIGLAGNRALAVGLLHWLSDNDQLSSSPIAPDLDIHWQPGLAAVLGAGLMGVLPALFIGIGLWSRSRRRRA